VYCERHCRRHSFVFVGCGESPQSYLRRALQSFDCHACNDTRTGAAPEGKEIRPVFIEARPDSPRWRLAVLRVARKGPWRAASFLLQHFCLSSYAARQQNAIESAATVTTFALVLAIKIYITCSSPRPKPSSRKHRYHPRTYGCPSQAPSLTDGCWQLTEKRVQHRCQ